MNHILLISIVVCYISLTHNQNFISFKFIIQNFQEQGDYHNNRNSSQNYNVILTKIKMKSMEQKIDFIIIYYSNNW